VNIDASHEGFGSSLGGLNQGLVGAVDFAGVVFFIYSVLPTLLKNFFVPVVILSSVEGGVLLGFNGAFLVSVLVSGNIFGSDQPSPIAARAHTSNSRISISVKMRAIRMIMIKLFDLLLMRFRTD
jgi:hypothetical protein